MDNSILSEVKAPETSTFLRQAQPLITTYVANSKAANTWKSYSSDWRDFTAWCEVRSLDSLPAAPETVAAYLIDLAQRSKVATVKHRLSAISQRHAAAGLDSPRRSLLVRATMQGIIKTHAPEQTVRQVQPAVTSIIYPRDAQRADQSKRAAQREKGF